MKDILDRELVQTLAKPQPKKNFNNSIYYENPLNRSHNTLVRTSYNLLSRPKQIYEPPTRPTLSLRKLKKLQAHIRGWYFRKKILPKIKQWHQVIEIYNIESMEDKITGKFLNEVIFDSIKEIKNTQMHNYTIKTHKRAVRYNEHIFDRVIKTMAQETLNGLLNFEAKRIIQNKNAQTITDPIDMISFELLTQICRNESTVIVDEVVKELSLEYKILGFSDHIFKNNLFSHAFDKIINEISDELIIENLFDDVVDRLGKETSHEIASMYLQEEIEMQEECILDECFEQFEVRMLTDVLSDNLVEELMTVNYEYIADIMIEKPNLVRQVSDNLINELRLYLD